MELFSNSFNRDFTISDRTSNKMLFQVQSIKLNFLTDYNFLNGLFQSEVFETMCFNSVIISVSVEFICS